MKIKKEFDSKCLNCSANLQKDDHYCPRCGQKVDRNDLSIRAVFREFFENYLSLDSRLGRTLYPFFFKPGYLTSQFINGVRRNYANPFRMYIFSSIFFFFCMNHSIKENRAEVSPVFNVKNEKIKSFDELSKQDLMVLNKSLKPQVIAQLNDSSYDNISEAISDLKMIEQQRVLSLLNDSTLGKLSLNTDSILETKDVAVHWNSNSQGLNIDFDLDEIDLYRYDPNYTDEMLYDTLMQGRELEPMEEIFYKRIIKIHRADQAALSKFMLGNLSLAMFVLIPLFAFFLKLFYWRRNKFYVAHLIHTIYLQSFAFIIFGFILLFEILFGLKETTVLLLFQLMAIVFAIYFIASFKRIYNQRWLKLLLKSFLLIVIYQFLAAIVFLGEVAISAILF